MNRIFVRRVQIRLRRGYRNLDLILVLACRNCTKIRADFVVALRTPGYITGGDDEVGRGGKVRGGRTGRSRTRIR
jgi:hypothetical protein